MRFFVGTYNVDMTYDDDMVSVARKNLLSVSGFWFDCVTCIPWSYMDLRVYLVSPHRPCLLSSNLPSPVCRHLGLHFSALLAPPVQSQRRIFCLSILKTQDTGLSSSKLNMSCLPRLWCPPQNSGLSPFQLQLIYL